MRFLIIAAVISFGFNVAKADDLTYAVDMRFLTDDSRLHSGTYADSEAYNQNSSNKSQHPVFAEGAILDFGLRKVHVFLIASLHDDANDVSFIASKMKELGVQAATLFIEQSDPYSENGAATLLTKAIQNRAPELTAALEVAQQNPTSILNPGFVRKLIFARVARDWSAIGRRVVNMDLASNFSDAAISFLAEQAETETAARHLRIDIAEFSFSEFRTILTKAFAGVFNPADVSLLKDCCGTSNGWVKTFLAENQLRDLLRERYMRSLLFRELKDGDVIVAHPVHMRHLLEPERRP